MRARAVVALRKIQEDLTPISVQVQPLWHPLGFVSCVVFDEDSVATRLHYWPAYERRPKSPNWPIHTHLFKLSSLVVTGSLRDLQYHCFPGSDYSGLRVVYSGEDSELVDIGGKYRIETVRETVVHQHGFYSIEEGVFHQSEVDIGQETLTLVQCTNHSRAAPIVLAPQEEFDGQTVGTLEYIRHPFERETFWNRVGYLIDEFLHSESGRIA